MNLFKRALACLLCLAMLLAVVPPVAVQAEDGSLDFSDVALDSLAVTAPTKTQYVQGEELDTTGMVVTVKYQSGDELVITDGYTVTGYDAMTVGEQTITVTFSTLSATFTVTVEELVNSDTVYCIYGHHNHLNINCSEPLLTWTEWTSTTALPTADGNWYVPAGTTITRSKQVIINDTSRLINVNLDLRGSTVTYGDAMDRMLLIKGAAGSQYTITSTQGQGLMNTTAVTKTSTANGSIYANVGTIHMINTKVDTTSITSNAADSSAVHITANGIFIAENCELLGGAVKEYGAIYQIPSGASGDENPINLILKDTTVTGGVYVTGSAVKTSFQGTVKLLPGGSVPYGIKGKLDAATFECGDLSTDSQLHVHNCHYHFSSKALAASAMNTIIRGTEGREVIVEEGDEKDLMTQEATTWCINGHKTGAACVAAGCTEGHLGWTKLESTIEKLPTTPGNYYFEDGSTVNLTAQVNTSASTGLMRIDLRGSSVTQTTQDKRIMLVNGGATVIFMDTVGGGSLNYASAVSTSVQGPVLYAHTGTLKIIGDITVDASACTSLPGNGGAIYVLTNGNLYIDGATIKGGAAINGGAIYHSGLSAVIKNATVIPGTVTGKGAAIYATKAATLENCTVNGEVYNAGSLMTVSGGDIDRLIHAGGQAALDLQGNVKLGHMQIVNPEGWGKIDNLGDAYNITLVNGSWGEFETADAAQAAIDNGLFKAATNVKLVVVGKRIEARPLRCVYGHTDHTDIECSEEIVDWQVLKSNITKLPTESGNYYFQDNATITLKNQADAVNTEIKYDIKVDLRGAKVSIGDNRAVILKGAEGSQYILTDTKGGAKITNTNTTCSTAGDGAVLYANVGTVRLIDVDIDSTSITTNTASGSVAHVLGTGKLVVENATLKGGVASNAAIYYAAGTKADTTGLVLKNVTVEGGLLAGGSMARAYVSGVVQLLKGWNTFGLKGNNSLAGVTCYDLEEGSVIEAWNLNYNFKDNEAALAAVENGVIVSAQEGVELMVDDYQVAAGVGGAVTALEIYAAPTKTEYFVGEELDTDGLNVRVTWETGVKREVKDYTVTGYDANTAGEQTITVTYGELSATFTVTVKTPAVIGLTVTAPTKTEYWTGEELDLTGMVVTAAYENDTTAIITEGYEVSGYAAETAGEQTITVTCGEQSATFTVTVKALAITGITVTAPTKVEYEIGEELDLTGMVVTGTYSNGTTAVITEGYEVSGYAAETAGEQTITVTYGEFTATFTVTVAEAVANVLAEGDCGAEGDNVKWRLTEDGVLTIYGTGAMVDYTRASQPWKPYRKQVTSIVVKTGVTYIGKYNFYYLKWAKSLTVPETVTKISNYASLSMSGLTEINYASSAAIWQRIVGPVSNQALLNTTLNSVEPTYAELKLVSAPEKLIYQAGEELDLTGLELVLVDAEGNETPVTSYILYGYNANSLMTQEITIIKESLYATFSVNVRMEGDTGADGNNIHWVLTDETMTLTGTGAMADQSARTECFFGTAQRQQVKNLVVEEGITYLGKYSFYFCYRLVSVKLPSTLTKISSYCFQQAGRKTTDAETGATVYLPVVNVHFGGTEYQWSKVTVGATQNTTLTEAPNWFYQAAKIESFAFTTMPKTEYTLGEALDTSAMVVTGTYNDGNVKVLDNSLVKITGYQANNPATQTLTVTYAGMTSELVVKVSASGTLSDTISWTLEENVLTISGEGAMPALTSWPWSAARTSYINEIVIAEGVTTVGNKAFYYTKSATTVRLPSTLEKVEANAFQTCSGLTDVYYAGTEADWANVTVTATGNSTFTGATFHYATAE